MGLAGGEDLVKACDDKYPSVDLAGGEDLVKACDDEYPSVDLAGGEDLSNEHKDYESFTEKKQATKYDIYHR